MQAIYVPKYKIYYRVSPKEPNVLQWSNKPFGPATQWQTAMRFGKPIRALDTDDVTGQGVVVLNDSSTYVGSGVRVWGRKFYPAGTRIYSLYAVGEAKEKKAMSRLNIKIHENNDTFLVWSIKFNDSNTASNEEYYLRDAYGSFFATAALGDTVYVKCEPFPGNKFTDDLIEGVIRRWYPKKPIDKITATPEIAELFNDIYEKKQTSSKKTETFASQEDIEKIENYLRPLMVGNVYGKNSATPEKDIESKINDLLRDGPIHTLSGASDEYVQMDVTFSNSEELDREEAELEDLPKETNIAYSYNAGKDSPFLLFVIDVFGEQLQDWDGVKVTTLNVSSGD